MLKKFWILLPMKFNYQELSTVSEGGMRLYVSPSGQYYPSITTILGKTTPPDKQESLDRWRAALGSKADEITKHAANKGTNVHLLAERFLNGENLNISEFSAEDVSAFNGLKLKLKNITEVWAQEVPLYSDKLQIAGRCDCIGVIHGNASIIDFKTSRKTKSSSQILDYKLQLTAYSVMHNEMFGTDIKHGVILMTSGLGFPQEFKVNLCEYIEPLKDRINKFYDSLIKAKS